MKQAYSGGMWQIIEPIMNAEVTAPSEFQSSVIGNLNKRSAIITNTDLAQDWFTVWFEVLLIFCFLFKYYKSYS